jgi:uncharacterized DUF497 family protein
LTATVIVHTISLSITFDPNKNTSNFEKHGVHLSYAELFDWDSASTWPDMRQSYAENRQISFGYIGERLFNVVYVDRLFVRRVISLRKANQREINRYAQT